ncbi:glycoside hydrolase family 31 protein [Apiospora arundinis]|uniref:alpha-glucosidase n=1 Tax=Apiospora arundinis TaxID=335852 RepID=A0ABR2HQ26_9PEZI
MDQYIFPCEPVANEESVVKGPQYRFTIINDKVLRYEWAEDGVFEDRASTFAINRKFPKPEFRVRDNGEDELSIITPSLHLTYNKKRFSLNGLGATFTAKMTDWGAEWRYGEEPGEGNLGGTARTLDGADGRCDMGAGIISKDGYSALDDSDSMLFDGNGFVTPRRPGDRIDGYLFCYGYDYQGAMESFYAVSGRQPIVPRWCLGNWWSRYHAYTQDEYLALMDKFQENEIPMSVAVVDMDWHWVKERHVPHTGWTGYTWNTDFFPDPVKFANALHERGLKMTLNDHPHAGIAHHEDAYEEMAKVLGHDTRHGDPIPFDPTSPEFLHAFFNIVHRQLEHQGCDFWWIDWQQGSHSRTPGFDPLWLLNHFQFLDTKQVHGNDSYPIIFSRYGGPGSHRYPVGFSGDTFATWASLEFQPEFTATASNIGYGWWSHDIGGHLPGYRDDECTARWVQLGAFSPILRLHSSLSRWMSKEPWLYRDECMQAMKRALQERHRFIPYIFSCNAATSCSTSSSSSSSSSACPLPLVQPMYWKYPQRPEAYRFQNQYFFGPSLVVAPVVTPRDDSTRLAQTKAWVPPFRHVDLYTRTVYDGDREVSLYRSLENIPVLAPEGAIIPSDRQKVLKNGCRNPTALQVIVVVGRDGQFDILEDVRDDDQERAGPSLAATVTETKDAGDNDKIRSSNGSALRTIPVKFDQAAGQLTARSAGKSWTFRFVSAQIEASNIQVRIDGNLVSSTLSSASPFNIVVEVPAVQVGGAMSEITIDIGANPQLAVLDHTPALHDLVNDFQTDIRNKDRIWEIIESKQPTAVKVSRLLSLGLDEIFYGPIVELLLADSRA